MGGVLACGGRCGCFQKVASEWPDEQGRERWSVRRAGGSVPMENRVVGGQH